MSNIEECHYCGTDVDTATNHPDHYHIDGEPVCDDCAVECGYAPPPAGGCEACNGDAATGDGEFCGDCLAEMAARRRYNF